MKTMELNHVGNRTLFVARTLERYSLFLRCVLCLFALSIALRSGAQAYWDPNFRPISNPELAGPVVAAANGEVYTMRVINDGSSVYRWTECGGWETIAYLDKHGGIGLRGALCIRGNYLYVGGLFTEVRDNSTLILTTSTSLVKYDMVNHTWSTVGDGSLNGEVCAIMFDSDGNLYAGQIAPPGGDSTECLKKWDGNDWTTVPGMPPVTHITALTSTESSLYVGVTAGVVVAGDIQIKSYVLGLDLATGEWYEMGNGPVEGWSMEGGSVVWSLQVQGTYLYAAGLFTTAPMVETLPSPQDLPTSGLYKYSTVTRQRLSFVKLCTYKYSPVVGYSSYASCSGLALLNNVLYVSGSFNNVYDSSTMQTYTCNNIAQWDGSTWAPLGLGLDPVEDVGEPTWLASCENAIIASGPFLTAGGVTSLYLARWVTGPSPHLQSTIQTVVGNHAQPGYYGNGGPATSAGLSAPTGISFGPSGELLFADTGNFVCRSVYNGIIDNPFAYYSWYPFMPLGVIHDPDNWNYYVADGGWGGLVEIQYYYIYNLIGVGAAQSVARDSAGNYYCVDFYMNTVSKRTPPSDSVVVAGNGQQGYGGDSGPAVDAQLNVATYIPSTRGQIVPGATVDANGNLYIADMGNNVIRKVDASGIITTVAGNHNLGPGYNGDNIPAVAAKLNRPAAVAVDAQGNLFIADSSNHRIRRVDHLTHIITTVAGTGTAGYSGENGPATSAQLNTPAGLAFDAAENLYISDTCNDVIRKLTWCP